MSGLSEFIAIAVKNYVPVPKLVLAKKKKRERILAETLGLSVRRSTQDGKGKEEEDEEVEEDEDVDEQVFQDQSGNIITLDDYHDNTKLQKRTKTAAGTRKRHFWTDTEDLMLATKYLEFRKATTASSKDKAYFMQAAAFLPDRTANDCMDRFKTLRKQKKKQRIWLFSDVAQWIIDQNEENEQL